MSGRHFHDYHLLLDEQAQQIFGMTDEIAERARKTGGNTLRSISDISKHQRLKDDNRESIGPKEMLAVLRADNQEFTRCLRLTHDACEEHNDVATASLIENWIDETQRRTWFLSETVRDLQSGSISLSQFRRPWSRELGLGTRTAAKQKQLRRPR